MAYVLGIDGGGTKTVCVLMHESDAVLSRGEGGPSNYQTVGIAIAATSIQMAIASCLKNYHNYPISGLCLGLAGVDRPEDVRVIAEMFQQLQLNPTLSVNFSIPRDRVIIYNDTVIALVGGLGHAEGIVAIAGTGSHVFGCDRLGKTKRTGGWGYILGDEGSAYYIAMQGLRAALRSYDGRLSPTSLTGNFQTELGLNSLEDLIEVVYRRGWGVKEIAALAPIVDRCAAHGDLVAIAIITSAVEELVLAVQVVIEDLFSPSEAVEIVTIGSVWHSLANLRDQFITSIVAIAPLAQVIWPRNEPAFGAGLIALGKINLSMNHEGN